MLKFHAMRWAMLISGGMLLAGGCAALPGWWWHWPLLGAGIWGVFQIAT